MAVHLKVIYRDGRELSMKLFVAICFISLACARTKLTLPPSRKQNANSRTRPFSVQFSGAHRRAILAKVSSIILARGTTIVRIKFYDI